MPDVAPQQTDTAVQPTSHPASFDPTTNLPPANPEPAQSTVSPQPPLSSKTLFGRKSKSKPFAKRKSKGKRIFKFAIITLAIMLVGFSAYFGSRIIGSINKVFHGNVFSDVHALISGSTLTESNGRINILLAGDSIDDPNHSGAILSDSIMVLSYSPTSKTGFILSIPRDLWVPIPGVGHEKINYANALTNFNQPGYPSGGIGQLQQIVQTDLGISIDYEATIDYTAFKDAVDTVGGITINIQSPDPRGLYDPYTNLKLPNGQVSLTGQQALNLARARGDGPGAYGFPTADFSRTQHQRDMLVALIKKSLSIRCFIKPG